MAWSTHHEVGDAAEGEALEPGAAVRPDDQEVGHFLGRDVEDPRARPPLLQAEAELEARARHAAEHAIELFLSVAARAPDEVLVHLRRNVALHGENW